MGRDHDPHGPALPERTGIGGKEILALRPVGETPHLIMAEAPRPRIAVLPHRRHEPSNSWAEFSAIFRNTRSAFLEHERAKTELKA